MPLRSLRSLRERLLDLVAKAHSLEFVTREVFQLAHRRRAGEVSSLGQAIDRRLDLLEMIVVVKDAFRNCTPRDRVRVLLPNSSPPPSRFNSFSFGLRRPPAREPDAGRPGPPTSRSHH